MSNLASFGSVQASGWAAQRREAIEKAKQLKAERSNNLTKTAEMTLKSNQYQQKSTISNQRDNFGSKTAKFDSIDDYSNTRNLSSTANYSNREDVLGVRNQNINYSEYPGDRMNKGTKQDYGMSGTMNRNTQNPQMNQNYRKQFKPDFQTDPSPQNNRTGVTNDPYKLKTIPKDSYGMASDNSYKNQRMNYPSSQQEPTKTNPVKRNPLQQDYLDSFAGGGNQRGQQQQQQRRFEQDNYEDQRDYGYTAPKQQQQQQKAYDPSNYSQPKTFDPSSNSSNYSRNQEAKGYSATSYQQRPSSREITGAGAGRSSNQYQASTPSTTSTMKSSQPVSNQNRRIAPPSNPVLDERPTGDEELIECPAGCGRSFFPHVIEKHAKNCQKVFQTKRKEFNAAAQRQTEDQVQVTKKKPAPGLKSQNTMQKTQINRTGANQPIVSKKADWKQQSEAFRANMKAARGGQLSKDEQVAIVKHQQDSLIPCNHCGRRFNEKAAERHIPFCQSKQKIESFKRGPAKGATATMNKSRK